MSETSQRDVRPRAGRRNGSTNGDPYIECNDCDRCFTDVGRDVDPAASDCWADHLDAATRQAS